MQGLMARPSDVADTHLKDNEWLYYYISFSIFFGIVLMSQALWMTYEV